MQARKQPPTRAWSEWLLAGVGLAYVAGFMLLGCP